MSDFISLSLNLLVFVTAFSFPGAQAAKIKKVKIRGYITKINSPTSFEIDDYRVTKDEALVLRGGS